MKIAFCTPGSVEFEDYKRKKLLGTELQVFGLAKEFSKRGHEAYIIRRWHSEDIKEELIDGVHVVNIALSDRTDPFIQEFLSKLLLSLQVRKEIKHIRPDVLVLTEIVSSYFVSDLSIPKVYVTHNPPGNLYSDISPFKLFVKKLIERHVFKNCKLIIALNDKIREYVSEMGYRCLYIQNAVEINHYNCTNSEQNYILFGGRLVKIKGLEVLIEAYSMLSEEIQQKYKLVIIGEGPEKKILESLVCELRISTKVYFLDWMLSEEFIKNISNCSFFVLPSLSECMPVTLIEAMALGKPVIASDIPGSKDIVTHGYNGFLFNKNEVIELYEYMCLLSTDEELRQEMGANARKTIEEMYTFDKTASSYESIFNLLLK